MDKYNWYFKQVVSQGEMDQAFDWSEEADLLVVQDLMSDPGSVGGPFYGGIVDGGDVSEQTVPDLTVAISAMRAWGKNGERIHNDAPTTNVDVSVDEYGTSSSVSTPGESRIISVFARFKVDLQDPAVDGNGLTVYTKQMETMEYFVRMGSPNVSPSAPALLNDAILLVDITRAQGQSTIQNGDMDFSRREDWCRFTGTTITSFVHGTPKEAIRALFGYVDTGFSGGSPFSFSEDWYNAVSVGVSGGAAPTTVAEALNAVVEDLAATGYGGALVGTAAISGTPGGYGDFPANSITGMLANISNAIAGHINGGAPMHPSSAVSAVAIADTPDSLSIGTVLSQLTELLGFVNARTRKTGDEVVTGAWQFANGQGSATRILELENHRFEDAPYIHTQLGGSAPPGSSIEQLAKQQFSNTNGDGAWWGSYRNSGNTYDAGAGKEMIGPVLGVHSDGRRCVVAFDGLGLEFFKVDPRMVSLIASSGSVSASLPATAGTWEGEAILGDGTYLYVMFEEAGVTLGTERHCIQAYNVSDFAVKTGWPATGTLLPGAAPTQGRHPDRGSSFGRGIPRMAWAGTSIVTLNTWVPATAAASPCLSVIAASNGTISAYGAGDSTTGANIYPLTGITVDMTTSRIFFITRDDTTDTMYYCSASLVTPSTGGGGASMPYTYPDAGASYYPGPMFFDGYYVWSFMSSWNATGLTKVFLHSVSSGTPLSILDGNVVGGLYLDFRFSGSHCATDGFNLYVAGRRSGGNAQSWLFKIPLCIFGQDVSGHTLDEYPGISVLNFGAVNTDVVDPYRCGGLCFDGDAIWACPNNSTSGGGVGHLLRYPMMRMR